MIIQGYLYKYRGATDERRLREIFVDHKLYFARVRDFNDPFDCRFRHSYEGSTAEIKSYAKRVVDQNSGDLSRSQRRKEVADFVKGLNTRTDEVLQAVEKQWSGMLDKIGICSFSKVNNEILLWSHYADSHRGICLEFDDDPDDQFFGRALPVTYSHEYPVLNPIRDNHDERLDKALLTKSERWSYEREYRAIYNVVETQPIGHGSKKFPKKKMTGVIFGCKATEETVATVQSLCLEGRLNLKFYRAEMDKASYSLNIVELA